MTEVRRERHLEERETKMKKKIFAIMLIAVMVLASVGTAFAQTTDSGQGGDRTITVSNPSKEETYTLYKLFDATASGTGNDAAINYTLTGDMPEALADYFQVDEAGNVTAKKDSFSQDDANAIADYAKANATKVAEVESDGSKLAFTGLKPGYYVVTSTLGTNATIDSAKEANVTIYDKNTKTIKVTKDVEGESYSIGDTVKYTATFNTVNFLGEGEEAKQVIKYVVKDTLPPYLSNVTVTSIKIDGVDQPVQQFSNNTITLPWASGNATDGYTNLYKNGATLVIKYEAVLTDVTNINADDKNTVSLHPTTWTPEEGEKEPWDEEWQDDAVIRTYAAAIHKVDEKGDDLAGAQFTIAGLEVKKTSDGVYTVVSYDPESTTASAVLDTDANGMLYIVGLEEGAALTVTEYKAPDGYNKIASIEEKLVPQVMTKEVITSSGTRHYDKDGNLVAEASNETTSKTVERNLEDLKPNALTIENNKGTEMPATGGMGTTILYIVGAALVLGAGAVLVTRRKADR
jgi:fimbrial isopeptide formation D2 family protein/LPXTG-motif cell wall-anchored protein